MSRRYLGFTLIEMLIVMGIMIILMAVGIAGGRFAIQRANRIQKQSATRNLYQAAMAFYTDNRQFPDPEGDPIPNPENLVTGLFEEYIDGGAYDGGVLGTYWVWIDGNRQDILFCAQYTNDNQIGGTCEGNGFQGFDDEFDIQLTQDMDEETWNDIFIGGADENMTGESDWNPDAPWGS